MLLNEKVHGNYSITEPKLKCPKYDNLFQNRLKLGQSPPALLFPCRPAAGDFDQQSNKRSVPVLDISDPAQLLQLTATGDLFTEKVDESAVGIIKQLMFLLVQSVYITENLVSEFLPYYVRSSNIYVRVMPFYSRVCFLPFFGIPLTLSLKQIQNPILQLMKYQGR